MPLEAGGLLCQCFDSEKRPNLNVSFRYVGTLRTQRPQVWDAPLVKSALGSRRDAIQGMHAAAWILVFAAHLGQAFVGGWVAARLGGFHWMMLAMIVGVLSLAGGIVNAAMLSSPVWTWIEMPFYLVVAWLAGRMELARRAG